MPCISSTDCSVFHSRISDLASYKAADEQYGAESDPYGQVDDDPYGAVEDRRRIPYYARVMRDLKHDEVVC
jgi:hypothetical protein